MITDNILLSHELVKGYGRKGISSRCMLKIDMQKANDSIEWPVLQQILNALNFLAKFIKWGMTSVQTMSYSISINGQPTKPFKEKKGLRQGDPLSPFLFVMAMEYLSRLLKQFGHNPQFKFHPKCGKIKVIHLGFVDDLLLFSK